MFVPRFDCLPSLLRKVLCPDGVEPVIVGHHGAGLCAEVSLFTLDWFVAPVSCSECFAVLAHFVRKALSCLSLYETLRRCFAGGGRLFPLQGL